jgi:hypothetical protein
MKNLLRGAVAAAVIAAACPAFAQSSPNWTKGKVPTAGEWNAAFAAKQDALGYVPLNVAGGVMTGRLITAPPGAATSGFNLSPGATPANPANGDMWVTPTGLFARINGATVGPFVGGGGSNGPIFINLNAAAMPTPQTGATIQINQADAAINRIELDTYGAATSLTGLRTGGTAAAPTALAANDEIISFNAFGYDGSTRSGPAASVRLSAGAAWSNTNHATYIDFATVAGADASKTLTSRGHIENDGGLTWPPTVTGGSKGPGTINAQAFFMNGVAAATTVNGQICAIGAVCTITASAGTISVGVTTVALGTPARVLFDNAGVLGEYPITGTGNVVMSASPTLTGTITALAANFSGAVSIGGPVTVASVLQTFPASGNIVGTTDTQSLSNKSLSGSNNTFTNVPNSALVNPQTTVNGTNCVLGSTCTPNAGPIVIGTTLITGGNSASVLFHNGTTVGEYPISGTGSVAMTNSPTLTTPTLGAAIGTSLALNGASIGSNALAVNGTSQLTGAATITSNSPSALAVGPNGSPNPVLQVNASTTSQASGISITGLAAGNGTAVQAIDSAANSPISINAKGSAIVAIGNASSGPVQIGQGGGGLQVFNSFNAAGLVTYADMAAAAIANASQYFSGASNVLVPASVIYQAETTTTFGGTTTFDFSTFINTAVPLTGNITAMTLNNVKAGQAGTIAFIQDPTGGRTAVFNAIFKFAGGATPALSSAPNAVDVLSYACRSATFCVASLLANVK